MRCNLCPRECGVRRTEGELGYCRSPWEITAARAALHMWEEPVLSGVRGSGTVFFSGCSLGCVYCQNQTIAMGETARVISSEKLTDIFLMLQDEKHAHNINLVTGAHYVPHIVKALERAKACGLTIPVVYNSSGYEKAETLRLLDGLVDIYLPDFKYMSAETAERYSHAPDYFPIAAKAIREMVRQVGDPVFEEEKNGDSCRAEEDGKISDTGGQRPAEERLSDNSRLPERQKKTESGLTAERDEQAEDILIPEDDNPLIMMKKGVIVRHLQLPGHLKDSRRIIRYLHETYGNHIYISIMNQYTPCQQLPDYPELSRKVTHREYNRLVDYAIDIGVEQGFIQEGDTAEESFIPAFDYEGL